MAAESYLWSTSRTMRIIIKDDTDRDRSNWKSLPKSFLPSTFDVSKHYVRSESKPFFVLVEPDDSIAAIKAYIQEDKGIPFKGQKLLKTEGGVLRDSQTLVSAGIKEGTALILRLAPITQITVIYNSILKLKIMVESDDTVADVKATIQEKLGMRFHKQRIIYDGRALEDRKRLVDCGIECNSVLEVLYLFKKSRNPLT